MSSRLHLFRLPRSQLVSHVRMAASLRLVFDPIVKQARRYRAIAYVCWFFSSVCVERANDHV